MSCLVSDQCPSFTCGRRVGRVTNRTQLGPCLSSGFDAGAAASRKGDRARHVRPSAGLSQCRLAEAPERSSASAHSPSAKMSLDARRRQFRSDFSTLTLAVQGNQRRGGILSGWLLTDSSALSRRESDSASCGIPPKRPFRWITHHTRLQDVDACEKAERGCSRVEKLGLFENSVQRLIPLFLSLPSFLLSFPSSQSWLREAAKII